MAKAALCLDTGKSHIVTPEDLAALTTPPKKGRFRAVPFDAAREIIRHRLERNGWEIVKEQLALMADKTGKPVRFFGTWDLKHQLADGVGLAFGARSSWDHRHALMVFGGERVFICDNEMWSAELSDKHKNTLNWHRELPGRIEGVIEGLSKFADHRVAQIDRMKDTRVSDAQVHDALVLAADADVIAWSGIGKVVKEWRTPSHDAHRDRNAWCLEQAFTEVNKEVRARNAADAARRTVLLTELFHGLPATSLQPATPGLLDSWERN